MVLALSVCAYALNQHQAPENKENNRVSYVDGKESDAKKNENLTPDQVNQKEGIEAEQIVTKVTDQGYVTSHGDHFHFYNGKVPYDAIFSEELVMKDPNYQLRDQDIVIAANCAWVCSTALYREPSCPPSGARATPKASPSLVPGWLTVSRA